MKKRNMIKKGIVFIALVGLFVGVSGVSAATASKTLRGGFSTTVINATATYDTAGSSRWSTSSASLVSTSGKGGGASKSGGITATALSGGMYKAVQKYSISATDFNYNTVSGKRTFTWQINGSSLAWGSCTVN